MTNDELKQLCKLRSNVDQRWAAAVEWWGANGKQFAELTEAIEHEDWRKIRSLCDRSPRTVTMLSRLCMLTLDEINAQATIGRVEP